jgi:hypothetical protein
MRAVHTEAAAISSDFEALKMRIECEGNEAQIGDIFAAAWYRAKHDLLMARRVYAFVCDIMGEEQASLHLGACSDADEDWGACPDADADDRSTEKSAPTPALPESSERGGEMTCAPLPGDPEPDVLL